MRLDLDVQNSLEPAKGRLLLSEPFMQDEYFSRAVVILCEHGEEGSFGFVLNNYLDIDLHEFSSNFPDIPARISLGGPVKNKNLYFIHTLGELIPNSIPVAHNIYLGGDYEVLIEKITENIDLLKHVRFFLGYSGWSSGQLDSELKEKSWLIVEEYDPQHIMDVEYDEIWKTMMAQQGGRYKMMSEFPLDPRLN
jgi:putative transcriptional regulator